MYTDVRWWDPDAKGEDVAERLRCAARACEEADRGRRSDILHRVRMYGNRAFASLAQTGYSKVTDSRRGRLNVVQAVCDTATNRLLGNRPKPTPLPISGSNWSIRRKARLLDRFLQGQMRVSKARQHMTQMVADAVIAGDAFIKIGEDGEQITIERVFSADLSVPPLEARAGAPRTLYQRHFVDRGVLLALYGDDKRARRAIEDTERTANEDQWFATSIDSRADQLEVVEGWRLPSRPGADDGRHVVALDDAVLHDEAWAHDYFPFVHLAWNAPYLGNWSDSLVDVVQGNQLEINRLVAKLARGSDLGGHTIVWVPMGFEDKFNTRKMTNEPMTFVPFTGERPRLETVQAIDPDVRQQIAELRAEAFELAGLTQSGADGVPGGLQSGKALSTWNDLGAIRFRRFAEAFEQAHIDLAHQLIDRARDLARKRGGQFAVPAARDRYSLDSVPWSEVDMAADQYVLAVYPTSSLPADPAGRVAAVETLVAAGIIPPDRGAHLLDFPDLEGGFLALDRAAYEQIEWTIETMLDEGKRFVPHPFMDLELALKLCQSHLLQAEMHGAPEDRQELLRQYMSGLSAMLDARARKQQELAAQAGAETGGMRPGEAGAPPAQGVAGVAPMAAGEGEAVAA